MERLDGKEKWSVVESPRERRSIQTLVQNEAVFVQYLDAGLWHLAFYNDGKDKEMVSFNTVVLGTSGRPLRGRSPGEAGKRSGRLSRRLVFFPGGSHSVEDQSRILDSGLPCVTPQNESWLKYDCCLSHEIGRDLKDSGAVKTLGQTAWLRPWPHNLGRSLDFRKLHFPQGKTQRPLHRLL